MVQRNRFSKIKGTKDFLVLAVACGFLCVWSIRDAWFPTEKILKKHPLEFPVTVSVSGVVKDVPVRVGEDVRGSQPLIVLNSKSYEEAVAAAEEAYRAEVESQDKTRMQDVLDVLVKAREDLRATTVACDDFILKTSHGESPLHGKVLDILVEPASFVESGQTVMLIQPADTFYMFNKTLAVLTFAIMIAALIFHRIASK